MANLSLVVDSTFKPFSFERYIQPWQIYGQAYKEQEDAYADLMSNAEEWGNKLSSDSEAYKQYKAYSDTLEAQAGELARNGLTPSSRQAMLNIRSRYNKDINPIKVAYERGRELADEQRKLYIADPTLRFDNDFSIDQIDNLIANPSMSYAALSGKDIMARASSLASQYAKTIMNDPKLGRLNKEYLLMKQQMGYTPEQILMEAMNDPNAPAELRRIREDIHNSLKDHAAYNRDWVDTYISQGMHSGIGTASYTPMKDGEYIDAGQRASLDLQRKQLALKEAQIRNARTSGGSGGSGSKRVAGYDKVLTVDSNGTRTFNPKDSDGNVYINGRSVSLTPDGDKYHLKAGDQVLATINAGDGKVTLTESNKIDSGKLKDYFGKKWDYEKNSGVIERLGQEILNLKAATGDLKSLDNYTFYLNPSDSFWGSNATYSVEPLSREMPTNNDIFQLLQSLGYDPNNLAGEEQQED